MDSKTIRYKNARYLADLAGGVSGFAEKIGKGQSQTSQFAGSTPIKGIGNKIAREIEAAFQKAHGWLDVAHPELWAGIDTFQELSKTIQAQHQSGQSPSIGNMAQSRNLDTSDFLAKSPRSQALEMLFKTLDDMEQKQILSEEEIKLLQQTSYLLSKSKKPD